MSGQNLLGPIAGAAAAEGAFSPGLNEPAFAAPQHLGQQNAGWYRYRVGSHEVTVVTDGVNRFRFPDGFIADKSRDEINAALAAGHWQPARDMVAIPMSPIVIDTGSRLIVMDTGMGEAVFATSNGAAGQFHANLKASGIDRAQVDTVIISHFHSDHINGLLTPDGKPSFPNADILVPAVEWQYFMDDGEMSRQTTDRMKGVFANLRTVFDGLGRQVSLYEPDKEVAPGITPVATHGHTPGHNSFIVASGSSTIFVQADVTSIPLFVRNPGWHVFIDQDPNMAEATRRRVYDMLVAEQMLVQGFHYPFPALAYVEKDNTAYRETLVPWNPTL